MKITVGGLLLTAGLGAGILAGPLKVFDNPLLKDQAESISGTVGWMKNLVKGAWGGGEPVVQESVPVTSTPLAVEATSPIVATEAAPVEPAKVDVTPLPPPIVEAAPAAEPVKAVPVKTKRVRGARRVRTKKVKVRRAAKSGAKVVPSAAAPVAASPAVANEAPAAGNSLIGTYVVLQLKSGREVKGVLQAKTPTHYKMELPGMGPFEYPVENVTAIAAAE